MRTSIEERAKTSYLRSNQQGLTIASSHEVGYIQGATEQEQITRTEMIDTFCTFLRDSINQNQIIYHDKKWNTPGDFIRDARKKLEGQVNGRIE